MKLKNILFSVAALLLFSACDAIGSMGSPQMDTPEAPAKVKELLKSIDTNEWKVVSISWSEDELDNTMYSLFIDMVDKSGGAYTQAFMAPLGWKPNAPGVRDPLFYKADPKDIPAIDMEKMLDGKRIMQHIDAAKKMIPAEYQFKSLASYTIDNTTKNEDSAETFSINVTEKGKETVKSAGQETLVYYTLEFSVSPNGEVYSPTLEKAMAE